jgi:hypothetical protein
MIDSSLFLYALGILVILVSAHVGLKPIVNPPVSHSSLIQRQRLKKRMLQLSSLVKRKNQVEAMRIGCQNTLKNRLLARTRRLPELPRNKPNLNLIDNGHVGSKFVSF